MSWTRYLLHDFWTARELNRMEGAHRTSKRAMRRRQQQRTNKVNELKDRIDELEQDLGEVALLLRTMTDLCIEKGVISADEMMKKAEHLDQLDGNLDGRMGDPGDSGDSAT